MWLAQFFYCSNFHAAGSGTRYAVGCRDSGDEHSGAHDVPQPLDAPGIERVEQHRVDSAWRRVPKTSEVERRRGGDPRALHGCDALGGAAEIAPGAQAHFDEHQHLPIARDDVDFAPTTMEIALDDRETAGDEEPGCQSLGAGAGDAARAGHRQRAPTGTMR